VRSTHSDAGTAAGLQASGRKKRGRKQLARKKSDRKKVGWIAFMRLFVSDM